MNALIPVAAIIGAVLLLAPVIMLADVLRSISRRGIFTVLLGVYFGRHHSGHHHTTATFWRDSDTTIQGNSSHHIVRRHHRAGWKNLCRSLLYTLLVMLTGYGLIVQPIITIVLFTTSATCLVALWLISTIRKARRWYVNKALISPLATGLAPILQLAPSDMEKAITMSPGWHEKKVGELGRILIPDTYIGEDDPLIERYIERRFPVPVEVTWHQKHPITVIIKADQPFPSVIRFEDRIADIEACKPGEYIAGYDKKGEPVVLSHNGDMPMKGYCMNTGTGKTVRVLSTAAQVLHNDSTCELVGFDVKQVSLAPLKGIPGVTIYDNPFEMGEMWEGWYAIKADMDQRYALKKSGQQTQFPVKWIFLEEGNTFAILIKSYYMTERREKGEPANAPIWSEAIAPILYQGREVGIYVNA